VAKILRGQNWSRSLRSPLTEIGVAVKEGDYLIAINGKPTNQMNDMYEAMYNTVGKQVTLKVNSKPQESGSRDVVVIPIESEQSLVYYTWVEENIAKVDKATRGKVGYIHIPDMGPGGLNEFVKYYYPQLRKKALIIDVRGNGGGLITAGEQLLQVLLRPRQRRRHDRGLLPHGQVDEHDRRARLAERGHEIVGDAHPVEQVSQQPAGVTGVQPCRHRLPAQFVDR